MVLELPRFRETQKTQERRPALLGERLVADGHLDADGLRLALDRQREAGGFLGEMLVRMGLCTSNVVGRALEQTLGVKYVDLTEQHIDAELTLSVAEAVARRLNALPIDALGETCRVAMADPLDVGACDDMRARLGRRVVPLLAMEADLREAIDRVYDVRRRAQSVLDEMAEVMPTQEETSLEEAAARADDAPIVRLVTSLVQSAISCRASDIHIEPYEDVVRVRFRMDGLLVEQMTIPRSHHSAVVSRIKILSRMDIAERRRPQDGRFSARAMSGHEFDLRVSVMPQIHGEKVVIRLLEKNSSLARMDKLGLLPDQRPVFEEFLSRPYGMVLVTGPTGSGKSTTLYAALNLLNDASRNINTVEDPVEYHLKGVNQVQVDTRIGVTFASALRTFLRQDPDVILVGEIRDRDTAEMSVQAALTGHLVLSTLHTNDAPGAIVRMQNMGVEPFLISSAVIGVLAQRLLRTICPHCREWYEAPFEVARSLGLPLESGRPPQIARGRGCTRCGGRGMAGRTAVYEIMPMTDAIRDMTLQRRPDDALRRQALAEGMISMREAGIRKVLEGETTPEEVARILCVEAS